MLRPDLDNLPDFRCPRATRSASPTEAELPAVFEMTVEAFAEHWGQYEADEQRYEEWADDPRFRRDLQVVAWKGDEPAALVSQRARDPGRRLAPGPAQRRVHAPGPSPTGLARACIAESLRLLRDAGADGGLPRRGHRQPQPRPRPVPVVRVRGREQQHFLPQALRWGGVDAANPSGALGLYEGLGFTVAERWQAWHARPVDGSGPVGWQPDA